MARPTPRRARRSIAALLIAALGWPSAASARAAPEPATPETTAPEAAPTAPSGTAPDAPAAKAPLTPEEIERQRFERRLEQADLHWQEGERLFKKMAYAEAAVEFERSYSAMPIAATLYSVGVSYARAGKPIESIRELGRYLELPDCADLPPEQRGLECPEQRAEAQKLLEEQRMRVGTLVLVLGEGVELRDVKVAGRTVPLDDFPLLLLPGTVDVEVFGRGPADHRTRAVSITGGEVTQHYVAPFDSGVTTRPEPEPEPEPDVTDELRAAQRQRMLRVSFGVGAGLTAAAGIATGVMGGLTLYHRRRFEAELCPAECWEKNADGTPKRDEDGNIEYLDRPYPANHEARFNQYRSVTNALVGVTVGLAVATALLGTFAFRKRARERASTGREGLRARVRVGATGLVVRW